LLCIQRHADFNSGLQMCHTPSFMCVREILFDPVAVALSSILNTKPKTPRSIAWIWLEIKSNPTHTFAEFGLRTAAREIR